MFPYSYSACTRTYEPLWQHWLRRCVRLYPALDEPGSEVQTVEATLRQLEHYLHGYLQMGKPNTPETSAEARGLLETAQVEWLGDAARCTQLCQELSAAQALQPLPAPLPPRQPVARPAASPGWRRRSSPAAAAGTYA